MLSSILHLTSLKRFLWVFSLILRKILKFQCTFQTYSLTISLLFDGKFNQFLNIDCSPYAISTILFPLNHRKYLKAVKTERLKMLFE